MANDEGFQDGSSKPEGANNTNRPEDQKGHHETHSGPRSQKILPFTSDDIETDANEAASGIATAIEPLDEHENAPVPTLSKPNPVLRDHETISDLQLRYFQLQVELKRIRDELNLSGSGQPQDENEDLGSEIVESEDTSKRFLESSIAMLQSEKLRLEERIVSCKNSEASWKQKYYSAKDEVEQLRTRLENPVHASEERNSGDLNTIKTLQKELSATVAELKTLKFKESEAKARESEARAREESLVAELKALRIQKRGFNETGSSIEETEELRSRLRRTVGIKLQISAMLDEQLDINDRNERLLYVAEKHINEINADLSRLSDESERRKAEITHLTSRLQEEEKLNASLAKQVEKGDESRTTVGQEAIELKQKLEAELDARRKHEEAKSQYEFRIAQQQEEIKRAEARAQEQKTFTKKIASELDQQKSRVIELKTRVEEGQKRNSLLSDLISQGAKDFSDAQKESEALRAKLHDIELEHDRLISVNTQLTKAQVTLHEKLDESERESARLTQVKMSEITKLNTEIEVLQTRLSDEADRYKFQLAELDEKRISEVAFVRERGKEESNKVRAEKAMRENEYKARIVSLENEILDLKDEKHSIETDRDSLLVRERKDHTQKANLETALSEVSSRLADAESSLQRARSEASDFKNKYDGARRAEEALIEKSRQLEQAVSKQTIRLQELSNEDLGALRRQAQDGVGSVSELMSLREEYSRQAAEWTMVSGSLNVQIQQLAESNKRLEDELAGWRNNESQREAQLRATVQAAHQHEVELMQNDYQYSLNIVKSSFAEAENERNDLKKQVLGLTSRLQNIEFEFNLAKQQLQQSEKARNAAESETQALRIQEEKTTQEQLSLQEEINTLRLKLKESAAAIASAQVAEHDLIQRLDEIQTNLKSEVSAKLGLETQIQQREKLFKESCEHLFAIVYANSQQIQSLVFIKCFFTKCFPRTDLPTLHGSLPTRKPRTLRGVASFVLATVKFKRAYRDGIKRKSQQSERLLLHG